MKKTFFILMLAFSALTLNSCLEGYNDATPQLMTSMFEHNWCDSVPGDTLRWKSVKDEYVMDTIAVGDSVRFQVLAQSFANSLQSMTFVYDKALLNLELVLTKEQIAALDTAKSDVPNGKLIFLPGYSLIVPLVKYYPRSVGDPTIEVVVISDANPDRVSNNVSLEFRQPIR